MRRYLWLALLLPILTPASALCRTVRFPLDHGSLDVCALNATLCRALSLPALSTRGTVNLDSAEGAEFLVAVNGCLGNGWQLSRDGSAVALQMIEPSPSTRWESAWQMGRIYAAEHAPHATAIQVRSWGLALPDQIDDHTPLVVLIHGLDADRGDCMPIGELLKNDGYQVAYFSYPGDQPIHDSERLFAREMHALRVNHLDLKIDLVAHSMGGLIARQYVEGEDYTGGVDHLIMVGPPNHGSGWARLRTLLSLEENYHLRRDNPDWNWTWIFTEGMGEAGHDLLPGSDYLRQLNSLPRRPGIHYTIVAGTKSSVSRVEADWMAWTADWLPQRTRTWWGIGRAYRAMEHKTVALKDATGPDDGPVSIESAKLKGVSDFVALPADHISLYLPVDGKDPAAWPVIRDRLRQ